MKVKDLISIIEEIESLEELLYSNGPQMQQEKRFKIQAAIEELLEIEIVAEEKWDV